MQGSVLQSSHVRPPSTPLPLQVPARLSAPHAEPCTGGAVDDDGMEGTPSGAQQAQQDLWGGLPELPTRPSTQRSFKDSLEAEEEASLARLVSPCCGAVPR